MKLNKKNREIMLNLFQLILPVPNKIPETYDSLLKYVEKPKFQKSFVCTICNSSLKNKICENENCLSNQVVNSKKYRTEIFTFDISSQLREIIKREYTTMVNYKSKYYLFYELNFFFKIV